MTDPALTVALEHAARVIRNGGVVAYPTEACFGLGCDPRNTPAVQRILRLKRRARDKGLILIADQRARLSPYVQSWQVAHAQEIAASWPGPNTWLMPCGARASIWLRGAHPTIAVRVTAHRIAAHLSRAARTALVSTSANRAGRPMLRSARAVAREFGAEIDFILPARIGARRAPSIIRHAESGKVIRG